MNNMIRILIVEDFPGDYELAQREIRKAVNECRFKWVEKQGEFLSALEEFQPDLILSDYTLPMFDGMKVLTLAQQHSPSVPVIIWTGTMGASVVVECLQRGACNYIPKDDIKRLGPAVTRALEERYLLLENKRVEERYRSIFENSMEGIFQSTPDGRYLSVNPAMARIYGYSCPSEMIQTITDIPTQVYTEPESRSQFTELLQANDSVKNLEMKNLRKDGSVFWTSTSARTVRSESGNILYFEGFSQDITERKEAEARLRESEEKYRILFESNPLPMWIYDLATLAFLKVNDAAVQQYGYSVEEFMSMTIKDIRPSEDLAALLENIANVTQGLDRAGTWRHCKKDGTVIMVEIISYAVEFAGRKAELVLAMDVTERIQIQNAEREQRVLNQALRHTAETLSSTLDYGEVLDQILTAVGSVVPSDAATIMLVDAGKAHVVRSRGYQERGLGKEIRELELSLAETNNLHQMLETKKPVIVSSTQSFHGWKSSAVNDWVCSNVGAPISLRGEVIGFILLDCETPGFFTPFHAERLEAFANQAALAIHNSRLLQQAHEEINARKRTEQALRESEERYRLIAQNAEDMIWTINMNFQITYVSPAVERALGYTAEEILASTPERFLTPESYVAGLQAFRDEVKNFQPQPNSNYSRLLETEYRRKNGTTFWVEMKFSFFRDATGHPVAVLGVGRDITERKLAENKLRESENRLILALSAAQMSVWQWDLATDRVLWSREFYEITGIRESDFDGTFEGYTHLIYPQDVARVREAVEKAVTSDTLFAEEFRIIRPNGEIRWLSNLGHAEYGPSGTSLHMIGTVQDITLRKQVEVERQALLEIMEGLARTEDLQEFLKLIHGSIGNVIHAENFFVVFHDKNTGLFEEIYSVDQYDPPAPPSKLEKSITSYVFRTGEPLLLDQEHFDDLAALGEVELVGTDSASWLGAPLKTPNGVIGVVVVQDYENPNRYSEHDKDFLASIATQVALALERKQAEEKLRESEARYRALFENSPISIWEEDFSQVKKYLDSLKQQGVTDFRAYFSSHPNVVDECTGLINVLDVNNAGLKMYRANSKKELIESTLRSACQGEQEHNHEDFIAIAEGKIGNSWEGADETLTGEPLEINLRWSVAPGHEHDFSKVFVTVMDITERKHFEDELRMSEERYRMLVNQLPAIVYTDDAQGRTRFISPQIETVLGFTAQEWLRENPGLWHSSLHEADRDLVVSEYQRAVQNASPFEMDYRIFAKDGRLVWLRDQAVPLCDSAGRLVEIHGFTQDITERKQAEEEIRKQTEMRIALYETTHDLVIERDLSNLLKTIVERVTRLLNTEGGGLYLCEPDLNQVRCVVSYNTPRDFTGTTLKYGEGAAGLVAETGAPLIIDNYNTWSGRAKIYDEKYFDAVLSVPIKWQDQVIGVIHALAFGDRRFDEGDLNLILSFANQAAIAIHNAQLHHGLEQQNRIHLALQEATLPLIRQLDISEVLQAITSQAAQMLNTTHGFIYLTTPGEREIELKTGMGKFSEHIGRRLKPGEGIGGKVWQSGAPLIIQDYHIWTGRSTQFDEIGFRSVIGVPLVSGSRVIGVLGLAHLQSDQVYDHNDLELLNRFAQLASIALENARLYTLSQQELAERKRIAEALQTAEEKYRRLVEQIPAAIYIDVGDDCGTKTYISPQIEKISGYPAEAWVMNSQLWPSVIHPEDRLRVLAENIRTNRTGELFDVEYRLIKPDGQTAWVREEALPIASSEHETLWHGMIADITERKQTEKALRESEERFSNAFEFAPIGKALVSVDGRWLKVNQALCNLLGYSEKELVTRTFQEITHPEDLETDLDYLKQMLAGELLTYQMEKRYFHRSGHIVWVLLSVSLVKESDGRPSYFIAQIQDVTQRKRAEEEIGRRAKETSALLETSLALTNLDLKAILHDIGTSAKTLFAADGCRIFLMQPDGDFLRCVLALQESPTAFSHLKIKLGEGVTGSVAANGQAEIVNDMQNDPRGVQVLGTEEEEEAIMFAPLKERDRTIGVLSIRRIGADRPFQADDLELLEAFASMAASAVSNARLFEETQRRLSELEALYENGLAVSQLLEPHQIGERLIETFARHLSWHHVAIRLLKPGTDELELIAFNQPGLGSIEERAEIERRFNSMIDRVGKGLSGWAVQTGKPVRTGNVLEHPQYVATYPDIKSGLYMPLRVGEQVIGVIAVESEEPDDLTAQDERLLATLANQAAVAFENARLYQAAQQEITERKVIEEALREERQRFLDLFENSPIPTWLEDFTAVIEWMDALRTQGVKNLRQYLEEHPDEYRVGVSLIRILNVNHAAVIMNGAQSKQELIDKQHTLMLSATASDIMIHELDMIWQGNTSFGFEMSSARLDGSLITGILRIYFPSNNHRPDYARVIVTSTDITERVEIERQLRASEYHYRELADSITDVLFELDHDLRYTHWNKASETLMGIPASQAIGKSMYELFGESQEQVRIGKIYAAVLEQNQAKTFETEIAIQGQKFFFEINANPSTRGVSVVARNITERKLSENLMQKRFELVEFSAQHPFEKVLQKTIDVVSELTGSHVGFIHLVEEGQTTITLMGWSTETIREFCRAEAGGMHYPVDEAGVWAEAVRTRQSVIHNDYQSLAGRKGMPDGHANIVREMVIPIIRNDRIVAVMGVGNKAQEYSQQDVEIAERFADYAWDITERKQMESALAEERNQLAKRVEERTADLSRANANLARALRVKDEFLANMSHELRTPLNAILGLSESLGEQVAGPLNEKQQKYLSTINESGHHLLSLINDILDLAKIEAGQITLDINKVDVNSVCQASLRMIRQLAQKKNQEVCFEIDEELGLMWADERRLKQMIVNLLSNAVKFTPESGKIGLEVRGDRAANKVVITVWDSGIGIREQDLERLFKPFVQLDTGLAREATGTGLGLALVTQMARLHGGSVHALSTPAEGSRFIIQLPWEPAMAADMEAHLRNTGKFRAIDPNANRPTILLIEDTREVVMMLVDYLEMAGYKMVTAQDGIDGLAQAKLAHPDLILMDIQMPRMDGFETTQKLRKDPEFRDIPIIALTALAMPNDRQRCLDAGMDEYMSKPVNLKALTKAIQKLLFREADPS